MIENMETGCRALTPHSKIVYDSSHKNYAQPCPNTCELEAAV